ncbi:hypothetical protein A3H22_03525 [Candidatus Peribacteria bacterium RIFCSPLOWO2_12_FULL_55_15]|nr:MAG: hypothetical protein A2789_00950 [Candidatus Peribacteria bacterium RIFCSPHIGHO2_01_FULL_54_22]OGJ62201.1 MAG: hypothetical protein A3D12_00065 [Candidatus Peribacteria bacterium RIFCSPHIGHO2_02_FULL_55_24]OGJ64704.1 MAG: hypothetical protein A3E47_03625 [Candidatus Peribacteria bacterium RIFCSPHIGHO2_12_FULL_54_10]OGJ67775.1 MAG: hypothetical protein A2947_00145 [Candidatus Peribacteria bacterium RIFCSPLOWO2_01_FULL_54_110]OGJ69920.1 MAG: hypothetical protein A3H90_00850 [Candidatus Pe
MREPLIHILLPTYEPRPDFLQAAMESAITQTEKRWTLHINDDASSVDVHTVVKQYLENPHITFARNPTRRGIGGNWNACLGEARRAKPDIPFLQFLFQDDIWHQNYLERSLHILETHPTVGFVSSDHEYDCEENIATAHLYKKLRQFRRQYIVPGLHDGKEFLRWWLDHDLHPNIIGEPSFVMLRWNAMKDIGIFDKHMYQCLDIEYWTRCLTITDWYSIGENLGTFRVHAKGASEQNRIEGRGMFDHILCIERAIRLLPMDTHPNPLNILSRTLEDMIGKFRREKEKRSASKNPLRLLPILHFCLRHPIIVGSALLSATRHHTTYNE